MTREQMIETSNAAVATANEELETLVQDYEEKRTALYASYVAMLTAHNAAVKAMWETSDSWQPRDARAVASDPDLNQPYQIPIMDMGFFHDKVYASTEEKEKIETMLEYSEVEAWRIRAPFVALTN